MSGTVPGNVGALRELANKCGVATEYWDFSGNHRQVQERVLVAVLEALGRQAATDEEVARSLAEVELEPWRDALPPSVVMRSGFSYELPVHVHHGERVTVRVELELGGQWQLSQMDVYVAPREVDGNLIGRATFYLPENLPLGWHELVAEIGEGEFWREVRCPLAVTPFRLDALPGRDWRGWGVMAQVYSTLSSESWGMGDYGDLADLAQISGEQGADFLLINPTHAGEPIPPITASPYLPVTRQFVSPLYVRPQLIEEYGKLTAPARARLEDAQRRWQAAARSIERVERDAAWASKLEALEEVFHVQRRFGRQAAFDRFRRRGGQSLENWGLWCALVEELSPERGCAKDGIDWPVGLENVHGKDVEAARERLAARIDFYVWLQWVADEQLAAAQNTARDAGMRLGVMADLAVGVSKHGADMWTMPENFAKGMGVGAPPDMYNQQGQNWDQPPWRPDALARAAYRPLRDMARTVLAHSGALRIDHILGMFRLWWVPAGESAADGTYVRYNHEAMLGVLLLEAHRAGAVVIGEDLGTVEPWVRDYLADRGVLGTSIMWFEKNEEGGFLAPQDYRTLALSTVNTHDLPPTAGYLDGEHVELRHRLGLLEDDVEQVRAEARAERAQMVGELIERGYLVDDAASEPQIIAGMHRFVADTPSQLVGVALVDAVGEKRAQNQPGTDEEYANWRIPLGDGTGTPVLVEDVAGSERAHSLFAVMRQAMGTRPRS
ncbi:4-alpha-glucanotransferase [Buchananella felis]|uniref:4-alpha-glucanotransferase n=1 Tax=Buchananella felis TaxID=3231492 RepID=UPI003528BAEF